MEDTISEAFKKSGSELDKAVLSFNMDGLPIYTSATKTFWPILVRIINLDTIPFVVAVWYGHGKATIENYVKKLSEELAHLFEHGMVLSDGEGGHRLISVEICNFICDTPARAFVKGTVSFNGFQGCQICDETGKHLNGRMSFGKLNGVLRTNESFRARHDAAHHKYTTPLESIQSLDMVWNLVTADDLHLLHLGVMRQLLKQWIPRKKNIHKWSQGNIDIVSDFLVSFHLPKEIHRANRSLAFFVNWKGLEYRNFLLYTGLPGLSLIYDEFDPTYKTMCSLVVGSIICSTAEYEHLLDVAEIAFQKLFKEIYGPGSITSNVHNVGQCTTMSKIFRPIWVVRTYVCVPI